MVKSPTLDMLILYSDNKFPLDVNHDSGTQSRVAADNTATNLQPAEFTVGQLICTLNSHLPQLW